MIDALAVLFIALGVSLAIGWAIGDLPQKRAGFAAALIAVFAGALLLLRGPLVRRADAEARAGEAIAQRASADAQELADLREQIDARTASLAASASEAKRIAAETRAELASAGERLARLEDRAKRSSELARTLEPTGTAQQPSGSPETDVPGLTLRQAQVLATSLRASRANELTLTATSDDPETIEFAQRLKTAIEAGGWTVHGVQAAQSAQPVVGLEVRAPVPIPVHATALLGALGRAGLQPKGSSRQAGDRLEVFVGSVPGKS
jgi:hypothetical protein